MSGTLIKLEGIAKCVHESTLYAGVDFQVQASERIGIVGPNGAGKTTLLNIIAGLASPDAGMVRRCKQGLTHDYLTQSRHEIDDMQRMDHTDAFRSLSKRLGLTDSCLDWKQRDFHTLSGGERTKLALASALSSAVDLLILDEPTNHLDSEDIQFLISELNQYNGSLVIVSHDRFFLDKVVTKIVEIRNQRVQVFHGNYSDYVSERDRQRKAQVHQYESAQRNQRQIEQQIAQLKQWATLGHQQAGKQGTLSERRQLGYKVHHRAKAKKVEKRVKSQISRLEKLKQESVEKPTPDQQVFFRVDSGGRHGNSLLEATRLTKRYGDRVLFHDSDFYVKHGDRIGIYGPNGCGKTTLLKMVCGEESVSDGHLWVSPSMQVAYLTQADEALNDKTVIQIAEELPLSARTGFRTTLANMAFTERHANTPISALSLGEQTRLRIAKLTALGHNLLVMDEPTNHLDVSSREELENALTAYQGTIILVTHDRYLMGRVCDTLLVFTDGKVRRVETRIAKLLGDISNCVPGTDRYASLDWEIGRLLSQRKRLRIHYGTKDF